MKKELDWLWKNMDVALSKTLDSLNDVMSHKIVFFIIEGSVLAFAWRECKTVKTSIRIPDVLFKPKFEHRATYMHSRCSIYLGVTFGWRYLENAKPIMMPWACLYPLVYRQSYPRIISLISQSFCISSLIVILSICLDKCNLHMGT